MVNVVTSTELTEMRSLALELGKKFGSGTAPETNKSRVAFAMADAMLRDLENAPGDGDWRLAYDMARAYSKSLNDTFTRSIVHTKITYFIYLFNSQICWIITTLQQAARQKFWRKPISALSV